MMYVYWSTFTVRPCFTFRSHSSPKEMKLTMDAQNGDSGNKSSATSAPTVLSTERSSDRIVGPFGIEPAHVFLIAAVPLCLGAYSGFQKQVKEAEKEAKELAHRKAVEALGKRPPPLKFTVDGRMLAARAFGIGTMLSLGSFAAVGACESCSG